ncbi:MAG: TIGR00725 family protein, partial [Fidelibacterota bacterium]
MYKNAQKRIISVFGGREADEKKLRDAEAVGKAIAEHGWVLLCGGRGGIMEAVSKGCTEAGGLSIGILPGNDRSDANPYIQTHIPTCTWMLSPTTSESVRIPPLDGEEGFCNSCSYNA